MDERSYVESGEGIDHLGRFGHSGNYAQPPEARSLKYITQGARQSNIEGDYPNVMGFPAAAQQTLCQSNWCERHHQLLPSFAPRRSYVTTLPTIPSLLPNARPTRFAWKSYAPTCNCVYHLLTLSSPWSTFARPPWARPSSLCWTTWALAGSWIASHLSMLTLPFAKLPN